MFIFVYSLTPNYIIMHFNKEKFQLAWVPFKLVCYFFLYQLLCTYGFQLLFHALNIGGNHATIYASAVALVVSGLLMIAHLLFFRYASFKSEGGSFTSFKTILLCLPLVIASLLASNIIGELLELPNIYEDLFYSLSRNVFGFLSIALIAPIAEEMLFRGGIEGFLLRRKIKPIIAILVSAIIFGVIHANPAQIFFATILGIIFGWMYYRTGSILPSVVGHVLNNTVSVSVMVTSPIEDMSKTTAETIGLTATWLLLIACIAIAILSFLYLNKRLPASPFNENENVNTNLNQE
ncbi:MAG: CPBP family intramembrane metalloprotease [Phocaeicola sp.]|nr:CPBP family intramembrane metalloprotease [Phocaeicola sp.]